MRSAPAVSVRCMHDAPWRWVQTLLPALAAAVVTAWVLGQAQVAPWPSAGAALSVAVAAGVAAWRACARSAMVLAWDGHTWTLDGNPGRAHVMIDLNGWVLLCFHPGPEGQGHPAWRSPAPSWLAVGAGQAGARWHALRVALYAGRAAVQRPSPAAGQPS